MLGHKAGAYSSIDDLWILTSYFNPQRYDTKRRNYELFLDRIERSKLNWMVVECAFGTTPFELRRSPRVLQIRASACHVAKRETVEHCHSTVA